MKVILKDSTRKGKKMMVKIDGKTVHFGSDGSSTYIDHKDDEKKKNYISRHSALDEDWTEDGMDSAGFWSRWLLWNKPTLSKSIKDIEKRFPVEIENQL